MQLKRSEFLLRQLLNHLGYTYEIKPYIIFINKRFLLYQAPLNARLIFRPQLQRFINKINTTALPVVDEQKKLAQQLMANTINKSAYERLPAYDYNKLKKGDRKSTRLNSSHVSISYAVFCLKKKKT